MPLSPSCISSGHSKEVDFPHEVVHQSWFFRVAPQAWLRGSLQDGVQCGGQPKLRLCWHSLWPTGSALVLLVPRRKLAGTEHHCNTLLGAVADNECYAVLLLGFFSECWHWCMIGGVWNLLWVEKSQRMSSWVKLRAWKIQLRCQDKFLARVQETEKRNQWPKCTQHLGMNSSLEQKHKSSGQKKWPTWCHCHPHIKHTRVEGARWLLFRKDIVKKAGQGGAVSLIEGGNHRIRKSNQACEDPVIMCLKLEWWADALGFPGTRGNFSLLLGASANCLRNKWMRRGWRSKSQEVAGRSWLSVSHINQMWLTCFP